MGGDVNILKNSIQCCGIPLKPKRGLEWGTQTSLHVGLERESCYKLQLTHAGKGATKNIGHLAVARTIDACVGWVGQVGMVEHVPCLYLKLHR